MRKYIEDTSGFSKITKLLQVVCLTRAFVWQFVAVEEGAFIEKITHQLY